MNTLKILQWNTLADTLSDAFPLINKQFLQWNHRSQLIAQFLKQHPCDVYCFEEVDHPEFFQQVLVDHLFIYQKKQHNSDGILIAYRKDLKLQSVNIVPFLENNKVSNQFFIKVDFLDFILVVTHLKAKTDFEKIRRNQLEQLNKCVKEDKVILCGDFNTQPELEAVSNFLEISGMKCTNTTVPTTSKNRGKLETNIKDYILYKGVHLRQSQVGPTEGVQINESGLPSELFPSDHIFLIGEFEI
ncbi:unnamed protein product (macronuclear) [Paramecium tetraurelia]|uniref:Endonuclease/exonuclease/phosphatase domain-containing protein n=1 Tax=Paramecium tetraurelia TaxID=5888 RepID=A0DZQ4_PARTE|nr:uncharacterized protein GSPATT00021689001 [Paramecium tetraurelia]CAK88521.1 unnamed protein product [Paramecium tetraurelia]|eukprot:XP_001455918.1 hypothetical protein (macronuclear) [Paramecium tetraurelia strain d4-2]